MESDSQSIADNGAPFSSAADWPLANELTRISDSAESAVRLICIQFNGSAHILLIGTQIAQIRIPQYCRGYQHRENEQELQKPKHPINPSASGPYNKSHCRIVRFFGDFITGLSSKITPFRTNVRKDKRDAAVLPFRLKKTVALVGMMGAGKSAIGIALARQLDVPFLDSDAEIIAASSMSIAEIFERDGEAFFRLKESQVIQRLLMTEQGILSTGGGAYLFEGNRATISQYGIAVWLRADLELLWQRVRHKKTRPLLLTDNPRASLAALYDQRVPEYAKADIAVDAHPDYSIEQMTDRVLKRLLERPDVLEELE